jgi:CheY-like chemotaxis protein
MSTTEEPTRRILWVDDEIEFLRAHIFFLEDHGWTVDKATNGHDALAMALREEYDVVLLDEQMAGIDGLTTLQRLKKSNPHLFVIMVTKSEEEKVMEEAIGRNIDGYLTKPVNPAQIVSLCRSLFNARSLQTHHQTSRYVRQYAENKARILGPLQPTDWEQIHQRLSQWDLDLAAGGSEGLRETHRGQKEESENAFLHFVESRWYGWMGRERAKPNFVWDLMQRRFAPRLKDGKAPILLILSGLRTDQWLAMQSLLQGMFEIKLEHQWALLPGIPEVSRLCLFGGASQKQLASERPEWKWPAPEKLSEPGLLAGLLRRSLSLGESDVDVRVAVTCEQGRDLSKKADGLGSAKMTAIVMEFAKMSWEMRSGQRGDVDPVPLTGEEHRNAARLLLAHAGIFHLLRRFQREEREVIITSDTGTTAVDEAIEVFCSDDQPHGFRVQFGKEISCDERHAFFLENPTSAGLDAGRGPMALAKGRRFFTQPNKYQYYGTSHVGKLVCGGLSMAEILVPLCTLVPR